jgi:peptidoglycan/xylan/chitin deacetylase (PgdA/CDA1 family)
LYRGGTAAFSAARETTLGSCNARRGSARIRPVRIPRLAFLVLCYHSVSERWEHALSVTPDAFREQVTSLARSGVPPVTAEALAQGARRGLHVTFDDAYRDVLEVLPLLEQLGLPVTLFVSTSFADGGRPLAVPELAAHAEAHPELLATMTWDELREAAERGVEVGSHTVTHPHVTQLSDAELERELADSKQRIEDELGRPARLLAYTYGEHDARVHAAVGRAGYAAAFAQWPGSSIQNPFALPRVSFYRGESLRRATLKTTRAGPLIASARERLGR